MVIYFVWKRKWPRARKLPQSGKWLLVRSLEGGKLKNQGQWGEEVCRQPVLMPTRDQAPQNRLWSTQWQDDLPRGHYTVYIISHPHAETIFVWTEQPYSQEWRIWWSKQHRLPTHYGLSNYSAPEWTIRQQQRLKLNPNSVIISWRIKTSCGGNQWHWTSSILQQVVK